MLHSKLFFIFCLFITLNGFSSVKILKISAAANILSPNDSCGKINNPISRVVGGKEIEEWKYSWFGHLKISFETSPFNFHVRTCGSTAISTNHVLTAAHCFSPPSDWWSASVHFGITNLCNNTREHIIRFVKKVFIHPEHVSGTYYYTPAKFDVALILLRDPLDKRIRPICLPNYTNEFNAPIIGSLIGFGAPYSASNCVMREATVNIHTKEECHKVYNPQFDEADDTFCAVHMGGGINSCQEDDGMPLQIEFLNRYYLLGLVSVSEGCAYKSRAGVYVNVTYHLQWILNKMKLM